MESPLSVIHTSHARKVNMEHIMYDIIIKHLGVPYIWGGNHPLEGVDCSGWILWLLRSVGLWDNTDDTSQGIYDHFAEEGKSLPISEAFPPPFGALTFYGKTTSRISHVGISIGENLMSEAGGGGRRCNTVEYARKIGAQTRIRPIHNRKDLVAVILPSYLHNLSDLSAF